MRIQLSRKTLFFALVPGLLLAPASARADTTSADAAFRAGRFEDAVVEFSALAESGTAEQREHAQFFLAQSLRRRGLPVAALVHHARIVQAGKDHAFYLQSVDALVELQGQLDDLDLIPNVLAKHYEPSWEQKLEPESLARMRYLVAGVQYRKAQFEEARAMLEAVAEGTKVHARAQYLLGVLFADLRYPGGPRYPEAVRAFERVLAMKDRTQLELGRTQQLARLGLARTYYAMRDYPRSTATYDSVGRFSAFWDQALFENGFARFQNDDLGGALGTLQALHAPQFAAAFQPESWILKATIYYFSCLFDESKASLAAFEEVYLPVAEKLQPLAEGDRPVEEFYRLVTDPRSQAAIPKPVRVWALNNEHMKAVLAVLDQTKREKDLALNVAAWRGKVGSEVADDLVQTEQTLAQIAGQLAKNRVVEAYRNIREFANQAEIIRFETAKAEKEFLETRFDQKSVLAKQKLHRPAMPGEDWNYWAFEGEFWIDEIGYYQYTLRQGCPVVEGGEELPPTEQSRGDQARAQ